MKPSVCPVISLLVHEHPEVVRGQLANIATFVPDATIVIHVSAAFRAEFTKSFASVPHNVFVNPKSLRMGLADGSQLLAHLENFRFIQRTGRLGTHFIFHASNELFVRHGLGEHLSAFDCGDNAFSIDNLPDWLWGRRASRDVRLNRLMSQVGVQDIYGSQCEGSFYRWDKMATMVAACDLIPESRWQRIVRSALQEKNRLPGGWRIPMPFLKSLYAQEEIFLPTLMRDSKLKYCRAFCWMNWNAGLKVSIADVDAVRHGNHDNASTGAKFFSVKRVDRNVDDIVRRHIMALL